VNRYKEVKMADLVDIASDFVDNELAYQVHRIRMNIRHHIGAKECVMCASEIPMGRRKLGYDLCIHCAELEERREALYAAA